MIVTANHYWVDVALGWWSRSPRRSSPQRLLARARPEAWAWRVGSRGQPREAEA